jgi:hypothetical protein
MVTEADKDKVNEPSKEKATAQDSAQK